jgi:G3E family GTPase
LAPENRGGTGFGTTLTRAPIDVRPVAVDVLAGFLGSGKTTLLQGLLDGPLAGERVAVVMNEIGDVSVDAQVITGMRYVEEVVELNSGCICCTIDDYRFDVGIRELIDSTDPSVVLIECTGVADPGPVRDRVRQAGLATDAVITVVDAADLDRHLRASRVVRRQIEAADFIAISKGDLVSDSRLRRVHRRLARLNRRALRVEAVHGRVEADVLVGTAARRARERLAAEEGLASAPPGQQDRGGVSHAHLADDGIEAFVIREQRPVDIERFQRFLEALPRSVYRAKGFLRVVDNEWSCVFNFTCGRYELNWLRLTEGAASTQAVFIGRALQRARGLIERRLGRCLVDRAS